MLATRTSDDGCADPAKRGEAGGRSAAAAIAATSTTCPVRTAATAANERAAV
jgi:hypothetical protein